MTLDNNDTQLDVLQNIEVGLKLIYERHPQCTDAMMLLALHKGRIAVKQRNGYGRGQNATPDNDVEQAVIAHIVEVGESRIGKINALTADDYDNCVAKISRSVDTHRAYGARGYYDFIKGYV
ncbi:MAG: hypothetical protein AAB263_01985 [Planctomycetota bacterium]